jgi:hypothetical protein
MRMNQIKSGLVGDGGSGLDLKSTLFAAFVLHLVCTNRLDAKPPGLDASKIMVSALPFCFPSWFDPL